MASFLRSPACRMPVSVGACLRSALTLIVWGERDRLVPLADAYEFRRLIPQAELVVFPGAGHVAMLEEPDRFNAALTAFAAANPVAVAGPDDH